MPHSGWTKEWKVTFSGPTSGPNKEVLVILSESYSGFLYNYFQSQGQDLRFYDGETLCSYFIESWNIDSESHVWVKVPTSGKTGITMEGDNSSASDAQESWTGEPLVFAKGAITGWILQSSLFGKFPRGANVHGATGGGATHDHDLSAVTIASTLNPTIATDAGADSYYTFEGGHDHGFTGRAGVATHLPSYYDLNIYKWPNSDIPNVVGLNTVAMFSGAPLGGSYSRVIGADGKFLRFGAAYGALGGSADHKHTIPDTIAYPTSTLKSGTTPKASTAKVSTHLHTIDDSEVENNDFKYFQMLLYAGAVDETIEAGIIYMFTGLPPLGWTRLSGIDQRYLKGNSVYGTTGGGGITGHLHNLQPATSVSPSGADVDEGSGEMKYALTEDHTHIINGNMDPASPELLYIDVIYGERKASDVTISDIERVNVAGKFLVMIQ